MAESACWRVQTAIEDMMYEYAAGILCDINHVDLCFQACRMNTVKRQLNQVLPFIKDAGLTKRIFDYLLFFANRLSEDVSPGRTGIVWDAAKREPEESAVYDDFLNATRCL
eukprot:Rmarinus@m.4599